MFFVPVMWAGYEAACMTPSGRAALGVTHEKTVRLLARSGAEWRVLREWPVDHLSHTEIMTNLGEHAEPDTPEGMLTLITAFEQSRPRPAGR
jgi:hypothetical protein